MKGGSEILEETNKKGLGLSEDHGQKIMGKNEKI